MSNKIALVVGGSSGVGAAFVEKLLKNGYEKIYIADRVEPETEQPKIEFIRLNLVSDKVEDLGKLSDIDTLCRIINFSSHYVINCVAS